MILLAAASFSAAQETGGADAMLIARAETRESAVSYDEGSYDTANISRAVREELDAQKNIGPSDSPPSINIEDIPLVMSSPDRKTVSVVVPPFLYFKTQF